MAITLITLLWCCMKSNIEELGRRLLHHVPIVIEKQVKTCETIELTARDIEDWLAHCTDKDVLLFLARRAKALASQLDDTDDFRSRA